MTNIKINSERKGSNPGGYCLVESSPKGHFDAYLKFCSQSRLSPSHPFKPIHQPVYEAVALSLAERFGLHVPRFFVLVNGEDVSFDQTEIQRSKQMSERMPFYLVSKVVKLKTDYESPLLKDMMVNDKFYRDLLMVGDVSGRRQNFGMVEFPHPHVLYIDLGCSFVDAHENFISQRKDVSKLTRDKKGLEKRGLRKSIKNAARYLNTRALITAHDVPYQKDILEFPEILASIRSMNIPTLNAGKIPLDSILCNSEITEIENLLTLNFQRTIRAYKRKGTDLEKKVLKV